MSYPETPMGDAVDDYHGTQVPDPYRWLEDPDSAETRAWVNAQNEISSGFLNALPQRAAIHARLEKLWNYERYSLPKAKGGLWFFTRNDGLQEQAPLYVATSAKGEGRILLDPNTFSSDGTVALADWEPSPDGKLLAYATSDGGSDWRHWYVLNVETGEHLSDEITRNKFGGVQWTADNEGLVYPRFTQPTEGAELHERNASNEVCLHRMGTVEESDLVLRAASPKGHWLWPSVTNSRKAVLVTERDTVTEKDQVEVISLVGTSLGRRLSLISGFDAKYEFIGNDSEQLWFKTNLSAPNSRVIAVDLFHPERDLWRELIPERDVALEEATVVGGHFLLSYLSDAHSEVSVHRTDGEFVRTQKLPGLGTAGGFGGKLTDAQTYFSYTSFTTPSEVWSLDIASGETELLRRPNVDLNPSDYSVRQDFFRSEDGTNVPMFLVQRAGVERRGVERKGKTPTFLYGYGGFNISMTPHFSPMYEVWLERGGLLAIANLRGGGEYGEAWHQAGTKLNKQNVFDDFIAAAEWLVAEGYTSPKNLAIVGGSNGGLLVGACMTQRPELFAAALPAVGVMDMLRYQNFTIGWAWARDYGTSADPAEFAALYAYSPLHNIEDGVRYPPTLVTTGDHDDRVVPAHSYKFTARMQAAAQSNSENPILIRIETRAGHGAGKSTSSRIDEVADQLSFMEAFTQG